LYPCIKYRELNSVSLLLYYLLILFLVVSCWVKFVQSVKVS
jgi:hypothetical protein